MRKGLPRQAIVIGAPSDGADKYPQERQRDDAKPVNSDFLDDVSVREIHGRSVQATEKRDQETEPKGRAQK
jgi:hypothetical protein